jgi:beta-mannosidase
MLRVWGGGIYETDEFYDICDEMGVLVWQDFLFACAMYPEEEPFYSEVEAEARYNVARLAHHPSLTIWNGCNENIWAYRDWGWKDQLNEPATGKQQTWGLNYYLDLLPRICKELTPTIPYWAASPWSGDADTDGGIHPNVDTHGNMHVWKPWFHEDYESYRQFQARFCSEFGFQGPATYSSIASVVPEESRDFGSIEMRHRQKSGDRIRDDGDRRNLRHLIAHFNLEGAPALYDALEPPDKGRKLPDCGCEPVHPAKTLPSKVNFDDLHYLLQVNQARALTLGVEWFRSRQPRCMGTLYWQLNDCWPGSTSWSCIDGDGRKKPLWYATRRFFGDSFMTFQPEADGSLYLYVVHDSDEPSAGTIWVTRRSFSGALLAEQEIRVECSPRSVRRYKVNAQVASPGDASHELIAVGVPTHTTWFFAPDKELSYPAASFGAAWSEGRLTIEAKSLMRDVCVFADRLDPKATVSEQLVTLLPGESFTFEIKSNMPLTKEQLTSPNVLRCVNPFGASAL